MKISESGEEKYVTHKASIVAIDKAS